MDRCTVSAQDSTHRTLSPSFFLRGSLNQWFSNSIVHQDHLEACSNQVPGPHPRASDSGRLGWVLRICVI